MMDIDIDIDIVDVFAYVGLAFLVLAAGVMTVKAGNSQAAAAVLDVLKVAVLTAVGTAALLGILAYKPTESQEATEE